jgi:hypothetical protein
MAEMIGRNINSNDTAVVSTYELNSVTATVISAAEPSRIHFSACLDSDTTSVDVFIRLYPASADALMRGEVLTRDTFGNSSLFRPSWTMTPDNIYTGEISAISLSGIVFLHVTEY